MKPVILFDIDYTLIDTRKLRLLIESQLIKIIKCTKKEFKLAEVMYSSALQSSTDFNPKDYTSHLIKHFQVKQKPLLDIFYKNQKAYKESLFPDTQPSLISLKKDYQLGIYSEGYIKFQMTKLKVSGLLPHFNKNLILIFRRKLNNKSLKRLPKTSLIVDDKKCVVDCLITEKGLSPIWINRKSKDIHSKAFTIRNLLSLNSFK